MAKVMLINVTHAEESRVAIVADGTLVSFEIESCNREHLKGNIYKGVVQKVQPGLEAAFVDIGAERNAFLPLDEICFRHLPHPPPKISGNGERRRPRIQDLLKPGDELLVQIVKEQFGSKPPTLSTFYSLPGRFLVLLPGSDDAGISRRIEGADRVRVREMVEKLHPPEGFGIIVRTVVGFDPGLADLQRDLTYLLRLWESIQQAAAQKTAPALVYREHDLVLRNIRDYFTPDIDEIYVDNEEVFERARQFLRDVLPEKEHALRLYQGDKPIFSYFNIETQIESIYKRRVPLKSGGYIVIDGTEALTAIDVNSGRALRGQSQEETAFRTNLEAAVEIARQLRLRDLGGLIVIDFIDMRNPQHISEVEKALRTAMFEDKARHEVGRISHFGLLEVSRQRLRPAATATTYVTCPMCDGYGLVRTTESAALVALRKVHNRVAQGDVSAVRVSLPTDVAMYLLNQKREDLAQLERRYSTKILVATKPELMPHQCEIEVKTRSEVAASEASPILRLGGVALPAPTMPTQPTETSVMASPPPESSASAETAAVPPAAAAALPAATSTEQGKQAKRRRRRGRRRGKGRLAAAALQEALSALAGHVSSEAGAADVATAPVSVSAAAAVLQVQETHASGLSASVDEEDSTPVVSAVLASTTGEEASEASILAQAETGKAPEAVSESAPASVSEKAVETMAGEQKGAAEFSESEGVVLDLAVEGSSRGEGEPSKAESGAGALPKRSRRRSGATARAARTKSSSTTQKRRAASAKSREEATAKTGDSGKALKATRGRRGSRQRGATGDQADSASKKSSGSRGPRRKTARLASKDTSSVDGG